MFGTMYLRKEFVSTSMIRGCFGVFCTLGGVIVGYSIGGVESAILGALIGFFLGKTVDSMLRAVDMS